MPRGMCFKTWRFLRMSDAGCATDVIPDQRAALTTTAMVRQRMATDEALFTQAAWWLR